MTTESQESVLQVQRVPLLKDPAFGAYVFWSKHFPLELEVDPRRELVSLLERASIQLKLETPDKAASINFTEVHNSSSLKNPLVNLMRHDAAEVNQAIGFTFLDSLTAQVMRNRLGSHSLAQLKSDLEQLAIEVITPKLLQPGEEGFWGGRLFLWAIVPPQETFAEVLDQVLSSLAVSGDKLFTCEFGAFAQFDIAGVKALLLLTRDNRNAEQWANRVLFEHTPSLPPNLLLLSLAECKFEWEFEQYSLVKPTLDLLSLQIDRRLNWMIDAQRFYESRLRVVGSRESAELLDKLSRATTDYADFGRAITRVSELRTTLQINAENYRSRLDAFGVETTTDDELFTPRWQQMERIKAQLNYESAYFEAVLQRGRTILEAASARLDILRGEQEKEQITFQGIQTSAITAIMAGLAALQILPIISGLGTQWFIAGLIITLMALTFAGSQILFNWKRVKTAIDRLSVSLTVGLLLSLPVCAKWDARPSLAQLSLSALLFFAGVAVGYVTFIYLEVRQRRKDERRNAIRESEVKDTIDRLLVHAREELVDLLEDLPPTDIYRVKARESLAEKFERKGYQHLSDVGDEIGVRYIVLPWEIPQTVKRIRSLVRVREVEYKHGDYKAVHIMVDLHGPGDDLDMDLTAEIQVKTPCQNRFALFAHDRLYKTGKETPNAPDRFYGWLLARICDAEVAIFRDSMGWPRVASDRSEASQEEKQL